LSKPNVFLKKQHKFLRVCSFGMESISRLFVSLGLLTPYCSNEIFVHFNFLNVACLKLLVSKALSILIIAGSFFLKVPQIRALMKARSSEGLSFTMFATETFVFAVGAGYGVRHAFPLSAFFENWVILAQVVTICVLIFHYKNQYVNIVLYIAALATFLGALLFIMPMSMVEIAFSLVIPILIFGRAPQIYSNYKNKNTGALSLTSLFMSFGGGLARVFTSLQEAPSVNIIVGLVIGVLLNLVLIIQILVYGGVGASKTKQVASQTKRTKKD
jgi:mannose-P-dolichol utilization defect protein 1